jgi:hypothetical protein
MRLFLSLVLCGMLSLGALADGPRVDVLALESLFSIPCSPSMKLRDFAVAPEGLVFLVSGLGSSGSYSEQAIYTTYSGALIRQIEIPPFAHSVSRVAVSQAGQLAIFRVRGEIAKLIVVEPDSGAIRPLDADRAGAQRPVEIQFLDEKTLLAGAYDGLYAISLLSGDTARLTPVQRVDLPYPFAILPASPDAAHVIEFTDGLLRTVNLGQGIGPAKTIESPEIGRIPQAARIYSAGVSKSGRVFCAVPGMNREEGSPVIELDETGALKSRYLLRLPGGMDPLKLRASDTHLTLSFLTGNRIAVYRLP